MQLLVSSMHRSGTSAVARILNMMGAYFGPEGMALGIGEENPRGFWERRDVVRLNDALLNDCASAWDRPLGFDLQRIGQDVRMERERSARSILLQMDAHRPWVLKDPRLCLTLPFWLNLLEVPIVVRVDRNPVEVATSLMHRSGIPLPIGVALWEYYTIANARHCKGFKSVAVRHRDLLDDPRTAIASMHAELEAAGVRRLQCPTHAEIDAFIDPALHRQKSDDGQLRTLLLPEQLAVWEAVAGNDLEAVARRGISAGSRLALLGYEDFVKPMHEAARKLAAIEKQATKPSPSEEPAPVRQLRDQLASACSTAERQTRNRQRLERLLHSVRARERSAVASAGLEVEALRRQFNEQQCTARAELEQLRDQLRASDERLARFGDEHNRLLQARAGDASALENARAEVARTRDQWFGETATLSRLLIAERRHRAALDRELKASNRDANRLRKELKALHADGVQVALQALRSLEGAALAFRGSWGYRLIRLLRAPLGIARRPHPDAIEFMVQKARTASSRLRKTLKPEGPGGRGQDD